MMTFLHTETRRGRCGEHANCFAFVLRSMGFEVHQVTDWTDHVWVEVYSDAQQRWMGNSDNYHTHEWGRKLTYIIAFSYEEVFLLYSTVMLSLGLL